VISIYYIWHRNCLLSEEKITSLEEILFMILADDMEAQDGLAEEDKELLESLERMAAEIDSEN